MSQQRKTYQGPLRTEKVEFGGLQSSNIFSQIIDIEESKIKIISIKKRNGDELNAQESKKLKKRKQYSEVRKNNWSFFQDMHKNVLDSNQCKGCQKISQWLKSTMKYFEEIHEIDINQINLEEKMKRLQLKWNSLSQNKMMNFYTNNLVPMIENLLQFQKQEKYKFKKEQEKFKSSEITQLKEEIQKHAQDIGLTKFTVRSQTEKEMIEFNKVRVHKEIERLEEINKQYIQLVNDSEIKLHEAEAIKRQFEDRIEEKERERKQLQKDLLFNIRQARKEKEQ